MKKKKKKEIVVKNISETIVLNSISKYEALFQNEETYQKLKLYIFDLLPSIVENYQEDNTVPFEMSVLFQVNNYALYFITDEVKKGNIDLEIKVIDYYSRHINSIYLKFDNWVNKSVSSEGKKKYLEMIESDSTGNKFIQKKFINKLWEDSIIESLDNYEPNETFSVIILKQFKNKLLFFDKEIEVFTKVKSITKNNKGV